MFFVALGCYCAVAICVSLASLTSCYIFIVISFILTGMVLSLKDSCSNPVSHFMLGSCLGLFSLAFQLNTANQGAIHLAQHARPVRLRGNIVSLVKQGRFAQQFVFKPKAIFKKNKWRPVISGKLIARAYGKAQALKINQMIEVTAILKPTKGLVNPFAFDSERYQFSEGLVAVAAIKSIKMIPSASPKRGIIRLNTIREKSLLQLKQSAIDAHVSSFALGLIAALLLGFKNWLSHTDWLLFQKTGLSHLIAISGLHIGLLAGLIMLSLKFMRARINISMTVCALIVVSMAFIYSLLAGFASPTERAVLMLMVFSFFKLSYRVLSFWPLYSLCFLIVILINPFVVLQFSFILSFSAVAYLGYFSQFKINSHGSKYNFIKLQGKLSLALIPFNLGFFHMMSVWSAIINFFAIPFFSFFLLPCAMLVLISLYTLPMLNQFCWHVFSYSADKLHAILLYISQHAGGLHYQAITIFQMAASIMGCLLALAPKGWPGRGLAFLFFLPIFFSDSRAPNLSLTLFDVGQGLSVLIRTPHHQLLFDTGLGWPGGDRSGQILPLIEQAGYLDKIVISHRDRDHVGGFKSIQSIFPKAIVYSNITTPLGNNRIYACLAGLHWRWDGILFQFLYPSHNLWQNTTFKKLKRNNHSCVLRVSSKQFSVLLPGDLESNGERYLLAGVKQSLVSDVLIAPHHGSKTSSSQAFIAAVRPSLVLVANAYLNRYDFPDKSVVKRYHALGAKILETASCGAIQVKSGRTDHSFSTTCWRKAWPHLWRRHFKEDNG